MMQLRISNTSNKKIDMGLIDSTSSKRRQIINEDDGNLGILHEDLLMEILLRLSVKDVLRCRSVSKHWLALTTTPYFINKHVLHHHDDDLDISRMIFFSSIRPNPTRTVTVFSVVSENKTAILQLDFLLDHITSTTKIMRAQKVIGSSNGIVCFFLILKNKEEEADETEDEGDDDDDEDEDDVEEEEDEEEEKYQRVIVVWNPVTKQFKIIPKPDTDSNIPFKDQDEKDDIIHVSRRCSISLGFPCLGFDSVNHYNEHGIMIATEYRLFRVFAHKDSDNTTFRAQIFVQNTNSWEPVKNELKLSSLEQNFPATRITVNGVMYWKVLLTDGECGVISFDMRSEVFSVVKLPMVLQIQRRWGSHDLLSWKDSLAIAEYEYFTESFTYDHYIATIWTMSNTKDPIWTSEFRIDSYYLPGGSLKILLGAGWQDQFLISVSRDDDAPSPSNSQLISYNPNPKFKRVEKNVLWGGDQVSLFRGGVNYVPTLAPV